MRRRLVAVCVVGCCASVFAGACAFVRMPGPRHEGPLPDASDEDVATAVALGRDVFALAGNIGERNAARPDALDDAAAFVAGRFTDIGFTVDVHEFDVDGRRFQNLIAEVKGDAEGKGAGKGRADEIVIVGAHYDTAPGTPGANDNASGVAVLLALAERFHGARPARTLRFVAFANEEPPYFDTPDMGSRRYALFTKNRQENIVAMLSLETLGCYSDVDGSQQYPFPFALLYPDRGDFVGFVSDLSSVSLTRGAVASFRAHVAFPSEGVAAPGMIPGIFWSDHASFWPLGVPALMVTDTALFRYEHYHEVDDTPDKVDVGRLARVTRGLIGVVDDLSRGDLP